ncbi:MAG: response regulator [Verrucomicrobiota bacterium]|nr:response regulator [Verrucomicrobiota bacterium]
MPSDPQCVEILAKLRDEIRTELNSILGSAELLAAKYADENIGQILVAGRRLVALADGLLADSRTAAESETADNSEPVDVLYIEDNLANFLLVERVLRARPAIQLAHAETGQGGIDQAFNRKLDLILLDLNLPDMHGSTVLEKLRATPKSADVPVIVISADATSSQIERLLKAGARNYLTKPFRIDRLLTAVDELVPDARTRAAALTQ